MEQLKQRLASALEENLGVEVTEDDIERPEPEHGDFAYPVMKAAAEIGGNPREIAQETAEDIELDFVVKTEAAGPGYLNFYLDREQYAGEVLQDAGDAGEEDRDEKVVVEHTSPNPNKPLHMGTMRTAILGDTVARTAKKLGYDVEVQDYINDLGRQTARTIYAYQNFLDTLSEEEKQEKSDFWIGLLYSEAGQYIEDNPEEEEKVQEIIRDVEEGDNDNFEMMKDLVSKSVKGQLETAYRTNIFYDLLPMERHVMDSNLLEECMDQLRDLDRVYEVEDGEDEGCVVIELSDYEDQLGGMKKPYKILFRSDGTATYTAKDIAFTMWKFGLLDSSFGYEEFEEQPNGQTLWTTGGDQKKEFGDADKVINVVGGEQAYVMDVIKYSLDALGYEEASENFHHMGFKFVYLPGKVSYSGRKGNWVGKHGDAVLERSEELALEEIQDRYDFSEEKEQEIAEKVAVAAVRYFIAKFTREKEIDFSFEKALDWEGDSGPYLLYSNARAHGILENTEAEPEFSTYEEEVEYELVRKLSEFENVLEESFETQEPAKIAHYLKELAEKFNSFYHSCPVNSAGSEELKQSRLALVEGYINVMEQGLKVMGITPLEEM
jgi:arginyl-tRNA synthetase